jgi:hypothetical protein
MENAIGLFGSGIYRHSGSDGSRIDLDYFNVQKINHGVLSPVIDLFYGHMSEPDGHNYLLFPDIGFSFDLAKLREAKYSL